MEENNVDEIRTILREITEKQRENEQEISRVTKIVGDIGNKFGSFTEGMAFPSMERVLRNQFGMTDVAIRYKVRRGGETMEIDVQGLANGAVNTVVIVETKSHLKDRDIEQALRRLDRFAEFFPEHKDKKRYCILSYVDGPEEIRQQAVRAGLYTARIHDEVFMLLTDPGFTPRDFAHVPVAA